MIRRAPFSEARGSFLSAKRLARQRYRAVLRYLAAEHMFRFQGSRHVAHEVAPNAPTANEAMSQLTMPADVELVASADPRPVKTPREARPD